MHRTPHATGSPKPWETNWLDGNRSEDQAGASTMSQVIMTEGLSVSALFNFDLPCWLDYVFFVENLPVWPSSWLFLIGVRFWCRFMCKGTQAHF